MINIIIKYSLQNINFLLLFHLNYHFNYNLLYYVTSISIQRLYKMYYKKNGAYQTQGHSGRHLQNVFVLTCFNVILILINDSMLMKNFKPYGHRRITGSSQFLSTRLELQNKKHLRFKDKTLILWYINANFAFLYQIKYFRAFVFIPYVHGLHWTTQYQYKRKLLY